MYNRSTTKWIIKGFFSFSGSIPLNQKNIEMSCEEKPLCFVCFCNLAVNKKSNYNVFKWKMIYIYTWISFLFRCMLCWICLSQLIQEVITRPLDCVLQPVTIATTPLRNQNKCINERKRAFHLGHPHFPIYVMSTLFAGRPFNCEHRSRLVFWGCVTCSWSWGCVSSRLWFIA